jgi:hypothetical protein
MAVANIRKEANEVREERASSLKSFFSNCFEPSDTILQEEIIPTENDTYIENKMYVENDTCIDNNTHIETNISVENDTYIENNTREFDIYTKKDTAENDTCIDNEPCENDTYPRGDIREKATYSEKTTRENDTYIKNAIYKSNTVKLAERLGFTALGVLAVLIDEYPSGFGMLNVTQLSKACGVARTTLIAQLRTLEKTSVIKLGEAEKQGRRIEITCIENTTRSENAIASSSSSSLKNNNYWDNGPMCCENDTYVGFNTHGTGNMCGENTTRSENAAYVENAIYLENEIDSPVYMYHENTTRSENDIDIGNDIYIENNIVVDKLSKSKITIQIAARELYFTAKASAVNINRLSNQCFQQFMLIKQAKGAIYAIALYYNLLARSRDNPNAYVIKAIRGGATASLEDEQRAVSISEAAETIFKKIGVDILQKDLDEALSLLALRNFSQDQIKKELDEFTKRITQ